MGLDLKNWANQKLTIAFGILLALSLINVISLFMRAKHIKDLTVKVNTQALIIEEKDRLIESDKIQYTNLASRLHKEIKKSSDLETELKKYRR